MQPSDHSELPNALKALWFAQLLLVQRSLLETLVIMNGRLSQANQHLENVTLMKFP